MSRPRVTARWAPVPAAAPASVSADRVGARPIRSSRTRTPMKHWPSVRSPSPPPTLRPRHRPHSLERLLSRQRTSATSSEPRRSRQSPPLHPLPCQPHRHRLLPHLRGQLRRSTRPSASGSRPTARSGTCCCGDLPDHGHLRADPDHPAGLRAAVHHPVRPALLARGSRHSHDADLSLPPGLALQLLRNLFRHTRKKVREARAAEKVRDTEERRLAWETRAQRRGEASHGGTAAAMTDGNR